MYNRPKILALDYTNPLTAAVASFKNMAALLAGFMYGTPERVRLTYAFAIGLALIGTTMMGDSQSYASCIVAG